MKRISILIFSISAFVSAQDWPPLEQSRNEMRHNIDEVRRAWCAKWLSYLDKLDLKPIPLIKDPRQSQAQEAEDIKTYNAIASEIVEQKGKNIYNQSTIIENFFTVQNLQTHEKYKGKLPQFDGAASVDMKDTEQPKKEKRKIVATTSDGKVIE